MNRLSLYYATPAVLLCISWILGIWIGFQINFSVLWLVPVGIVLLILGGNPLLRGIILPFLCLLCALSYSWSAKQPTERTIQYINESSYSEWLLQGVIIRNTSQYSLVQIQKLNGNPASGLVHFYSNQFLKEHGRIIAKVKLILTTHRNPGSHYSDDQFGLPETIGTAFPIGSIRCVEKPVSLFLRIINNTQNWIKLRIKSRFIEKQSFVQAIVLGNTEEMGNVTSWYRKAGLSHLLAVSGFNMAILYSLTQLILLPLFRKKNIVRWVTIPILCFFGLLCDMTPSVVRAVIMLTLFMINRMLQKPVSSINILAWSLIIITLYDPAQIYSIGLQLSYIAVLVLVAFPIDPNLPNVKKVHGFRKQILHVFVGAYSLLFSTVVITLYILPLSAYYFHMATLNGIVGNLVGIPLSVLLLPLAIWIILLPNWNWIVAPFHLSFVFFSDLFDKWLEFSSKLPFTINSGISKQEMLIIYLCLLVPILWLIGKRKRWVLVFILSAFLSIGIITYLELNHKAVNRITFFDVGQGDCSLVETADGRTILIDTGPPSRNKPSIAYSLLPYCSEQRINKINYLILTHNHADHIGGFSYLETFMPIDTVIVSRVFMKIKEPFKVVSDSLTLSIGRDTLLLYHWKDADSENNHSIITLLHANKFSALFSGDLEMKGEQFMQHRVGKKLDVLLLKVGHHGSRTSSSLGYLRSITPTIAYINASSINSYGFPNKEAMFRLQKECPYLFVSGKDGALQVEWTNTQCNYKTFGSGKKGVILLSP